ncbi:MAG TPA: META domain-containing protein [Microthrixaceae bacterium]|nr:META domain-containing protein [Microthrixaceae bacterium]
MERSNTRARHLSRRHAAGAAAMALLLTAAGAGCGKDEVKATKDSTTPPSTTAAAGSSMKPASGLAGTSWKLTGAVANTVPTLAFDKAGTFSANTGCNTLNGSWTAKGDALTLKAGPMTQMACLDAAANTQETTIVDAFAKVAKFNQTDTSLKLLDASGKDLLAYEAVSGDLAGTSWKGTGVNTGSALVTSALVEKVTLDFGADGTVSGSDGCNTFTGTYTLDGANVSFSELASTKKACAADVQEVADQYVAGLAAATKVERSGNSLTLRDDAGAMQFTATLAS